MRRQVWERWQAAAGPWRGWAICPLLTVPGPERAPRMSAMAPTAHQELRMAFGEGGGTAVVLDLEPVVGVHLAAHINAERIAHAVVVLPRWPYTEAILPCGELLDSLTAGARLLTASAERLPNVVFVLDAQRNTPLPGRSARDRRADNRFRLSADDLPGLTDLRSAGIRRVVKVSYG